MANWNIHRSKAIDLTVDLVRTWRLGDLDIVTAAEMVARKHYIGRSWVLASRALARDARREFWSRHSGRTVEQERAATEINEMAQALQDEGWRMLYPNNEFITGYMWLHDQSGICVNRNGGLFDTFEAATRRAFHSPVREMVAAQEGA